MKEQIQNYTKLFIQASYQWEINKYILLSYFHIQLDLNEVNESRQVFLK